jgi:transcriptional regulator with XRE-family HTH domain
MAIGIRNWATLGQHLREARVAKRLTQAELARAANVSRQWLSKVESGHRGAELEPLLRLIDALDLTLTLTGDTGEEQGRQRPPAAPHLNVEPAPDGVRAQPVASSVVNRMRDAALDLGASQRTLDLLAHYSRTTSLQADEP